jgi:HlyD family secretion protein
MADARKQTDRRWIWIGTGIFLVIVFFTVRNLTRERLPVRIAAVERQSLFSTVSTNGRVEPRVNYELHSPIATTVEAVYVQPGDVVPAGKLLMKLDDIDARVRVASAESALKAAQADLDTARNNGTAAQRESAAADIERSRIERDQAQSSLNALTHLQATGAASAAEVDAARQRLATAQTSYNAALQTAKNRYTAPDIARAQAAVNDAQSALAAAQHVLNQTSVVAPIAGTVYTLNCGRTEFVQQGAMLLQIADLKNERVRAYFDEPEIGRLAVGQPIVIKWDAKPGKVWHGHIERVPVTVIIYGTRTVGEVLISIDGPDGDLLPDTNVTVTVTTASQPNALSIPREALFSQGGQPYVYKIVDNALVRTNVQIGALNLTQVAILSGLKEGDRVATGTTSGQPLQEGLPIKVMR